MGTFSVWHWVVVLMMIVGFAWPMWRIVGKTGYHPALSLLSWVPLANILLFWYLAFAKWPVERD